MEPIITESSVMLRTPDGVSIPGILVEPNSKPIAQLLLLHGITTHKDEFANFFCRMAFALGQAGVTTLRIDFRGHGESSESSRAFTIASQVLDTLTAIEWLRVHKLAERIDLLGCSFGAPPAIFTADIQPFAVGSINLVCPVLDYRKTFLEPTTEWAAALFNNDTLTEAYKTGFLQMAEGFCVDVKLLVEMNLLKPFETLRHLSVPVLIVHGEADSMVPYAISQEYADSLQHVRLVGIPRMDHGFMDQDDELGNSQSSQRNFDQIVREVLDHIRNLEAVWKQSLYNRRL